MILGLAGGYCVGKSTVADHLASKGWTVVDVDKAGHAALEREAAAVAALLGPGVLGPDGRPDRRAIGRLVFSDPATLRRYEAIIHPTMNAIALDAIRAAAEAASRGESAGVCVDAALLYRLPAAEACDAIIEVRAPYLARLARARSRDGYRFLRAVDRLKRQWPREAAARYAAKTVVVVNGGDRAGLLRKLDAAIARLAAH